MVYTFTHYATIHLLTSQLLRRTPAPVRSLCLCAYPPVSRTLFNAHHLATDCANGLYSASAHQHVRQPLLLRLSITCGTQAIFMRQPVVALVWHLRDLLACALHVPPARVYLLPFSSTYRPLLPLIHPRLSSIVLLVLTCRLFQRNLYLPATYVITGPFPLLMHYFLVLN